MVDVVTDSQTFTITILEHGNVTISELNAPSTGWQGEDFVVTYVATNSGGEDTCYGRVYDEANPSVDLDRWEETIPNNGTRACTHTININTTGVKNLVIQVGYTK